MVKCLVITMTHITPSTTNRLISVKKKKKNSGSDIGQNLLNTEFWNKDWKDWNSVRKTLIFGTGNVHTFLWLIIIFELYFIYYIHKAWLCVGGKKGTMTLKKKVLKERKRDVYWYGLVRFQHPYQKRKKWNCAITISDAIKSFWDLYWNLNS